MLKQGKKVRYERVVLCGGDRERWKHWTQETRPRKIQHLLHQRRKILNTPKKFGGWVGAFFDIDH